MWCYHTAAPVYKVVIRSKKWKIWLMISVGSDSKDMMLAGSDEGGSKSTRSGGRSAQPVESRTIGWAPICQTLESCAAIS
jgi:hypothetical protein